MSDSSFTALDYCFIGIGRLFAYAWVSLLLLKLWAGIVEVCNLSLIEEIGVLVGMIVFVRLRRRNADLCTSESVRTIEG